MSEDLSTPLGAAPPLAVPHAQAKSPARRGPAVLRGLTAAVAAITALACGAPDAQTGTEAAAKPAAVAPRDHHVTATYFHTRARCATCIKLETYARQSLEQAFAEELADGRLVWRSVNFHEPEHRHYMQDYDLQYQSLILTETRGGQVLRWRNLDQIWQLVGNPPVYAAYVRDETAAYLEAVGE